MKVTLISTIHPLLPSWGLNTIPVTERQRYSSPSAAILEVSVYLRLQVAEDVIIISTAPLHAIRTETVMCATIVAWLRPSLLLHYHSQRSSVQSYGRKPTTFPRCRSAPVQIPRHTTPSRALIGTSLLRTPYQADPTARRDPSQSSSI